MQTQKNHPLDAATTETLKAFSAKVIAVFSVRSMILFGSRARGEFNADSDADVAVLLIGRRTQFMDVKRELSDMAFEVMLETGIRVEAIPIWEDEWHNKQNYKNPSLLHNIEHDGVVLQ